MPRIRITEGSPIDIRTKKGSGGWKSEVRKTSWNSPVDWNKVRQTVFLIKDPITKKNCGIEIYWP